MSRGWIGVLLLLVGSMIFGVIVGQKFFALYEKTIPPMALSNFSVQTARGAFLGYGIGLGVLLFGFCLIAVFAARFFRSQDRA